MQAGYEKLDGIERDRLFAILEPVLYAHGVEAVEVIWQTDNKGWLLTVTVEKPGSSRPGDGVSIDLCAEISRDLSTALDVESLIPQKYRLEVGSPGLERRLYRLSDYGRFSGCDVKLKLQQADAGQFVIQGMLQGLNDEGLILVETPDGQRALAMDNILSGRLEFNWKKPGIQRGKRIADAPGSPTDRKPHDCGPQRSK